MKKFCIGIIMLIAVLGNAGCAGVALGVALGPLFTSSSQKKEEKVEKKQKPPQAIDKGTTSK